jgi:hypothetical protein
MRRPRRNSSRSAGPIRHHSDPPASRLMLEWRPMLMKDHHRAQAHALGCGRHTLVLPIPAGPSNGSSEPAPDLAAADAHRE